MKDYVHDIHLLPAEGTAAETYWHSRCLTGAMPKISRYLRYCQHRDGEISLGDGRAFVTVHGLQIEAFLNLNPNGSAKADCRKVGGVIRAEINSPSSVSVREASRPSPQCGANNFSRV